MKTIIKVEMVDIEITVHYGESKSNTRGRQTAMIVAFSQLKSARRQQLQAVVTTVMT